MVVDGLAKPSRFNPHNEALVHHAIVVKRKIQDIAAIMVKRKDTRYSFIDKSLITNHK